MDEVKMKVSSEEKDLGVIIDNRLTFDQHIMSKVKKANSVVGLIRRTFSYLDSDMFKTLFTSIVRPILEYAAPVWNPYLRKHIIGDYDKGGPTDGVDLFWPPSTTHNRLLGEQFGEGVGRDVLRDGVCEGVEVNDAEPVELPHAAVHHTVDLAG